MVPAFTIYYLNWCLRFLASVSRLNRPTCSETLLLCTFILSFSNFFYVQSCSALVNLISFQVLKKKKKKGARCRWVWDAVSGKVGSNLTSPHGIWFGEIVKRKERERERAADWRSTLKGSFPLSIQSLVQKPLSLSLRICVH